MRGGCRLSCREAASLIGPLAARAALGLSVLALTACSGAAPRPTAGWQPTRVEQAALVPPEPVRSANATPTTTVSRGVLPKVAGVYKVGKPYSINGVMYEPAEDPSYDRVGMASWYGTDFHGKRTANGEVFDMHSISAAHPTLPMPSYVQVTNLKNGRTMLVRVNDRGPYKPGRIIDLSYKTAQLLGFDGHGVTEIRVRYAGPAPLDPRDDRRERHHLASQPWSKVARAGWDRPYALGLSGSTTP